MDIEKGRVDTDLVGTLPFQVQFWVTNFCLLLAVKAHFAEEASSMSQH